MGLIVSVYKDADSNYDCTMNGVTNRFTKLCVTNVDGPFDPSDDCPAVKLVEGNLPGTAKIVPEECEVPVVPCLDLLHPAVEFLVVDSCGLIAADLPGEQHVFRGQRYTVAPGGTFANCVVDGEPVLAVRRGPVADHAIFARWQNLTQQADQIPFCVINRERPPAHAEDQR